MINSILIAAPNNFSTQHNIPLKLQAAAKKGKKCFKIKTKAGRAKYFSLAEMKSETRNAVFVSISFRGNEFADSCYFIK